MQSVRLALLLTVVGVLPTARSQPPQLDEPVLTADGLHFPEGSAIPRSMTELERVLLERRPLVPPAGTGGVPSGPVHCPAEYEPMDAILIAWEGDNSWKAILGQMSAEITTTGDADLFVVVDSTSERNSTEASLAGYGVDMDRVQFVVRTTDTIWIRDYGPRYIYEGQCRAIVDHTYNRNRPWDNALNGYFADQRNQALYEIPLVHGGGNYHLNGLGESFTSRLINNENPGLTEQEIHDLWLAYQNVDTTFFDPLPSWIDSTQHIDMWMQVISDDAIVISDWPQSPGSTQDQICDVAAADLAARGFTVHRIPAVTTGTHYTFTNVVMCNDLVLVPSYTNATASQYNDDALAVWEAALPDKTIVQVPSQAIVTAAGVLHCIVMHVPAHLGGENPTAYLRTLRGGEVLEPGEQVSIEWISDDDVATTDVDLLLSTDGGANYDTVIAESTADDGEYVWTVPDVFAADARVRVVVRDADGNTGSDESPAGFTIDGGCTGDLDGDDEIGLEDLSILLGIFGACDGDTGFDPAADFDGSGCVDLADLSILLGLYGSTCS